MVTPAKPDTPIKNDDTSDIGLSSLSSSHSRASDESDTSDIKPKRQRKAAVDRSQSSNADGAADTSVTPRRGRPKRKIHESESSDDDDARIEADIAAPTSRNRDRKQTLCASVLKRWWYCLPPWPPEDWTPDLALKERKLIKVDLDEWDDTEDVNEEGFTKVYELSQYPGVFRGPDKRIYDLRPLKDCPNYTNFMKKSESELVALLIKALENQIKVVKDKKLEDSVDLNSLMHELREARNHVAKRKSLD